jgi:hypothetical protein
MILMSLCGSRNSAVTAYNIAGHGDDRHACSIFLLQVLSPLTCHSITVITSLIDVTDLPSLGKEKKLVQ